MKILNRHKFLLFISLSSLMIYFGSWEGQILSEKADKSHAPFLVVMNVLLLIYTSINIKSIKINFVFFKKLRFIVSVLLVNCFFRPDILGSLRNFTAIVLTYSIIFLLVAIFHSIPLKHGIKLLIYFSLLVFLPVNIGVHLTQVGSLVILPDRTESNILRFGGLFYYAHTAMVLGFSLCLMILSYYLKIRIFTKPIFLILIAITGMFLVFTDCRSVWAAMLVSFGIIFFFSKKLNTPRIYTLTIFLIIVSFSLYILLISNSSSGSAQSDLAFRGVIWQYSVDAILNSPLIGYGSDISNVFSLARKNFYEQLSDPHSALLALALQSGLIVTILFLNLYTGIAIFFFKYSNKNLQSFTFIIFFWTIAPFFWGFIYNGTPGFITIFFPFTFISILLHKELYSKYQYDFTINNDRYPVIQSRSIY